MADGDAGKSPLRLTNTKYMNNSKSQGMIDQTYCYGLADKHLRKMHERDYFSQAGQDLFVLSMLEFKTNGYYIEIGGADPFESNNTFLLERDYSWKGLSLEFDNVLASRYNSLRKNSCICADATNFNYFDKLQRLNYPIQIDYLSVDIDPAANTYLALEKCPFNNYRFSVITFEHELYSSGPKYMELSRIFLKSRGYQLVARNVKCFGRTFEDWWIDPNIIPKSIWEKYVCEEIEFTDVLAPRNS